VLRVGQRSDRVWHFWSPSPRAALPPGKLEGCTVRARVRISAGALLQMGMDYWLSTAISYGSGGNYHEAGASNWYFASPLWQEVSFTDAGGPQF
jgi:hypothetical protein